MWASRDHIKKYILARILRDGHETGEGRSNVPVKNVSQERHLTVQPLEMGGTEIYHKIKLELIWGYT